MTQTSRQRDEQDAICDKVFKGEYYKGVQLRRQNPSNVAAQMHDGFLSVQHLYQQLESVLGCCCVGPTVYECLLSGSTKAAVEMMSKIGVTVLESIVVDELTECTPNGRDRLLEPGIGVTVTSLVRTESVDAIPGHHPYRC